MPWSGNCEEECLFYKNSSNKVILQKKTKKNANSLKIIIKNFLTACLDLCRLNK